jgi:hypothetical protein
VKIASYTLVGYALLILLAGIGAYQGAGSIASLVSSLLLAGVLVASAVLSQRGKVGAAYIGGILVFLSAIYFAYRFIASERFLPSGVLLIISFVALFLVILGVFLTLSQEHQETHGN